MQEEINIIEDSESEMLQINYNGSCLFEGNYWDFDRSGEGFKKLLVSLGFKVNIEEKDYSLWY